ncbi:MAG: hypothetical protein N3F07_00800 [Candidatus Micrarchaeota archaeon]|nr:hypothetical protein [Candidatus Micrarchaeota archaeon]
MKPKFPHPDNISWDKIKEVKITSDEENHKLEFNLDERKQKIVISLAPGSISYTLCDKDGSPLLSAIQKGNEVKVLDFSKKLPAKASNAKARIRKV